MTEKEFSKLKRPELLQLMLAQGKENAAVRQDLEETSAARQELEDTCLRLQAKLAEKETQIARLEARTGEKAARLTAMQEQADENAERLSGAKEVRESDTDRTDGKQAEADALQAKLTELTERCEAEEDQARELTEQCRTLEGQSKNQSVLAGEIAQRLREQEESLIARGAEWETLMEDLSAAEKDTLRLEEKLDAVKQQLDERDSLLGALKAEKAARRAAKAMPEEPAAEEVPAAEKEIIPAVTETPEALELPFPVPEAALPAEPIPEPPESAPAAPAEKHNEKMEALQRRVAEQEAQIEQLRREMAQQTARPAPGKKPEKPLRRRVLELIRDTADQTSYLINQHLEK